MTPKSVIHAVVVHRSQLKFGAYLYALGRPMLTLSVLLFFFSACADKQIAEMEQKCTDGNKEVCQQIAMVHWDNGEKKRAVEFFRLACEQGQTNGCLRMAENSDLLIDQKRFLKRACDLGNTRGCAKYLLLLKQQPN